MPWAILWRRSHRTPVRLRLHPAPGFGGARASSAVRSKPMPEGLASGGAVFKPWLVSLEEHHRDPLFSFVEGARDGISITIPIYVIIVYCI